MRQLRINFFLMHIKPSCTGSSQSTNFFLFSKGQSKKLERNISCCASSKLWEILHYPNGSGEKLKETWPDFQLLEVLSNPKFSPAPQNCCECHTSANYIHQLTERHCPAPGSHWVFSDDFLPSVLPCQVSQYFHTFLCFTGKCLQRVECHFLIWFAVSKGEVCWWAPTMCRCSAFAVHGKMLPRCLVFQGKMAPLDRDLVLSPLAKSLGFKSFLATSKSVTFSISCSALASSQFSLKSWLLLQSYPYLPLFWGVLHGCKAEGEAQSLMSPHLCTEHSFTECGSEPATTKKTSLLPVQPALGPKAQALRHTGWQGTLKLSLLPELLPITHSCSLLYHALQISSRTAGTPE